MSADIRLNRALASLIGIQICINGCMAGVRMAAPLFALREGHGAATVGVLLALFAFIQLFLAIPAGRYADRHDLKRPIMLCIAASVLGALLPALWPSFPMLFATALLTGAAIGTTVITLQRHAARMASTPTQLKQVFAWIAIAPAIANFVGPFLAGLVIDYAGFRACFAAMAVLALAAWLFLPATPPAATPERGAEREAGSSWSLLADPRMRRLMLVSWVLTSCWDVHTFVLPLLGHERGLSASVIGTILGSFAVAATVVRMLTPMIAARLQEGAVITTAMIATALLYGVYPLLQSPLAMGICSVLLGFSLGSVQPMIMSALHSITPPHRHGEALGLRLMSVNVSSILAPLAFGVLGSVIGVASVFWAVGASVGASAPAAWKLKSWQERGGSAEG